MQEDNVGAIDHESDVGIQIAGFYPFSHATQLAQLTGGKALRMSERNARIRSASSTPLASPVRSPGT